MNQTELDFRATGAGTSQEDRLADWLLAHPGEWYSMIDLGAMLGCWAVHSRVAGVRARLLGGGDIENEQRVHPENRKRLSYYRYVPASPCPTPTTPPPS